MTEYWFGPSAEMLRCRCGYKYIVKSLPDRLTDVPTITFFDWFNNEQAFGQACVFCGSGLYSQWQRATAEWAGEWEPA